jgi:hypothetical protein
MRPAWRIVVLATIGILASAAAGLAGLVAAFSDWNWRSPASDLSTASASERPLPAALTQTEDPPAAFAPPDDRLSAPPVDVGAVELAALPQSADATLLEWPAPELSPSSPALGPAKTQSPGKASPAQHRRSFGRLDSVFNDAQIASIKGRLKLTREQERMWPPVETALRNLSYAKAAMAQNHSARDGDRITYIDLDGPQVQELKSAALPLITRLSEDQKRELRSLAHLMGLNGVEALL